MTDETMTLETFEACISAYGADPDAWPQAERAALQQFAADNPQAAALLARERALDGLLAARLPQPPETLQAAVLAGMHAAMDAAPDAHRGRHESGRQCRPAGWRADPHRRRFGLDRHGRLLHRRLRHGADDFRHYDSGQRPARLAGHHLRHFPPL